MFWKKLRIIVRAMRQKEWYFTDHHFKKIRSKDKNCCPLSSVIDEPAECWLQSAQQLDLDPTERANIIRAADRPNFSGYDNSVIQLRRIFLKAAKLY